MRRIMFGLCVLATLLGAQARAETVMTVLVTGANRGIGLEFARQLEARGMNVIGTARKPDEAAELRETGARVEQLDVTDSESLAALAARLDGVPIDMLINNAGVGGQPAASFMDTDFEQVEATFAVNSLGPMRVTQALMPNLEAGRHKTIIQISSVMSSIERNGGGYYGYRASKAALNMLTRTLALELYGDGFICVLLHPGWVQTRLGGPGARKSPEQSVAAMLDVIAGLDEGDNGRFYDYEGRPIPW
ncbi:MAG: SDR family oxidoreductase [Pseudomonadota bacterium]